MATRFQTTDITYDGLALSVALEFEDFGAVYVEEIMAASDGTAITHLFTDCVQSLIKFAALDAIKAEAQADVCEPELEAA